VGEDQASQGEGDESASGDQAPRPDTDRTKTFGESRRGVDFINPEAAPVDEFRPSLDAPQPPAAQSSDSEGSAPPAGGDGGEGGNQ